MSKRILHLLSDRIESDARSRLFGLLKAGCDDRFEVHLTQLVRKQPSPKTDVCHAGPPPHVRQHMIDAPWAIDPRAYWRLGRHLSQLHADLIHYWDTAAAAYGLLAAGSANPNVATVVESAAIVSSRRLAPDGWLARRIRRMVLRRTSTVITPSETSRCQCLSAGLPAEQIRLIARGAEPFESLPGADELRGRLQIPSGARLIAAFGPERYGTNLKNVIWAFDLLQLICQEAHLVIIGAGPRGGLLKQFRDDLRLSGRVHFVDRDLACPEVGRLMAGGVDVVWSADVRPTAGSWLARSLASGIAVIATEGHETSEMIGSGQSGYLLRPGDRAGYARITVKLLDDAALRRQISQAASEVMRERYSMQTMMDGHSMLYEELLGRGDYLSQKSSSADRKQN